MSAPLRATGGIATAISVTILSYFLYNKTRSNSCSAESHKAVSVKKARINSLSDTTGCEILGKAEFLNPGGSVKDRVAVKIIEEASESGPLAQGGVVTEGSAGSTAISLATVAPIETESP